jgi:hypothetical protein
VKRSSASGARRNLAVAGALLALAAVLPALRRLRRRQPERARIDALYDQTSVLTDGAVRSIQSADLTIDDDALEELWTAMSLERLARTYWRFLTRVTLGAIRVVYTPEQRWVVFMARPFKLLTFAAPEYDFDGEYGKVRWSIERGVLVSRRGRGGEGYLEIDVRRLGASSEPGRSRLHLDVEVANFYPAIASGISRRLYNATQSRIHVIVTLGFLRSLTKLDLADSRVGRFVS